MLGLVVELIISWLLLWVFFKDGLSLLGIAPTKSRVSNLLIGLFIAAACGIVYYLSFVFFTSNTWTRNNDFTVSKLAGGSWWTFQSVLYEELIFRGALLYILIHKLGIRIACLISAICFGVYHWFTTGAVGDPMQMVIIFILTATWGAMFAMAFARTKSLYLPIGLHFGWNFISAVVFSQGPLGKQLLILNGDQNLSQGMSLVMLVFQVVAVPAFAYLYMNWVSKSN